MPGLRPRGVSLQARDAMRIFDASGARIRRRIGFLPAIEREDELTGGWIETYAVGFAVPLSEQANDRESLARLPVRRRGDLAGLGTETRNGSGDRLASRRDRTGNRGLTAPRPADSPDPLFPPDQDMSLEIEQPDESPLEDDSEDDGA